MPTPTKRKILERARELFHHREGTSISPEESELKESGYMNEAKEDLMGTKKGSEAYSQQERYMQDMGNEMDLSVRPKGEMRLDKWRMRAYREAAMPTLQSDRSPKVVHFPSLSERASTWLHQKYSDSEPWRRAKAAQARKTAGKVGGIAKEKAKTGITNLVLGTPEARQQKKEEAEAYKLALISGRRYGIKHEAYWQGFREGRSKASKRSQNGLFAGPFDIGTGLAFMNKDPNEMFSLGSPRRITTSKKKKKNDLFDIGF